MNSKIEIDKFLNEYLKIYQENPRSRVFAPLAEAYRKSNLIDEAIEICIEGLSIHPNFTSGIVALARSYFDKKMYEECINQLKNAISQAPDNYLAQKLLAESYFIIKDYQNSIKTYKVLSFLNPKSSSLKNKISELEFLLKQDELKKINTDNKIASKNNEKQDSKNTYIKDELPPIPYNLNQDYFEENQDNLLSEIDKNLDLSFQEKPLSKLFIEDINFYDESILKEFKTHTLAELLRDQGHKSKALEVYKNIYKENPDDSIAKEAIFSLEQQINKPKKIATPPANNEKVQSFSSPKKENKQENKLLIKKEKNINKTNITTQDNNWIINSKNKKIEKLQSLISNINKAK